MSTHLPLTFKFIPTSTGAGIAVPSVVTFAAALYNGGHEGCHVGGLSKLSQICN